MPIFWFSSGIFFSSWWRKGHEPSRAQLKIVQLEPWLEPARLGFITIIYLLCNPDISHLITYSTLSGNCDSTSFFRRRSKKGLKTLCNRRIIKIVSSSFNSTFSPWKNINQIKASLLFNNLYSQIIQKQFRNWIWIIGTIFRVFRPSFRVWDHSFKTSDNFHDFWPLHPYHWHSSKMLMKGFFYPYVLWPFDKKLIS